MQVLEDVERVGLSLTPNELWARPGGAASAGFHIQHLAGSLDRLFTYARGESLNADQRKALAREKDPGDSPPDATALVHHAEDAIAHALDQLRATPDRTLLDERKVGRAGLPSTVLGLLFHAAEHSTRHAGQLITTAKIVRNR
jgi:uncharacterized damage-inducible protein DinB